MCIECARRKLQVLADAFPVQAANAGGSDARWFMCVRDHDAHVHIRVQVDLEEERPDQHPDNFSSEWIQINTTFETFKEALAETGIATRFHMHEDAPKQPNGLSEQLIANLPQFKMDGVAAESAKTTGDLCPVCYDVFREDDMLSQLPCSHKFHAACVGVWLQKADTCPACRAVVTESAVEEFISTLGAVVTPDPGPTKEPAPETELLPEHFSDLAR